MRMRKSRYKYIAESESDNRAWTSKTDAGLFCFARHMSVVDQRRKDGFFTLDIIGDSAQTKLCNSNLLYKVAEGSGHPEEGGNPGSGADHWNMDSDSWNYGGDSRKVYGEGGERI